MTYLYNTGLDTNPNALFHYETKHYVNINLAEEMKLIADDVVKEIPLTQEILKKIKTSAEAGRYQVTIDPIDGIFPKNIEMYLRKQGFSIKYERELEVLTKVIIYY